jgi:hypothetical protein
MIPHVPFQSTPLLIGEANPEARSYARIAERIALHERRHAELVRLMSEATCSTRAQELCEEQGRELKAVAHWEAALLRRQAEDYALLYPPAPINQRAAGDAAEPCACWFCADAFAGEQAAEARAGTP